MDVLCQSGVIWINTDRAFPLTTKHTYIQHSANYSEIIIIIVIIIFIIIIIIVIIFIIIIIVIDIINIIIIIICPVVLGI